MEIITGYTGEHHVTSADDASLYRSIIGPDDYVLNVGSKFEATIIDNNTVRIADGDLVIQGHQARIRANDYEEVTIDNGSPGQKRHDLIVARYQKDTVTGIESVTLEVVKGTPGTTATDPEIVQEDLTTGGTQRDFALYRVSLDGLALESVTSLFNVSSSLMQIAQTSEIVETGENANGHYVKWANGLMICFGQTVATNVTSNVQMQFGGYRSTGIPIPFAATFDVSGGIPIVSTFISHTDVNGKAIRYSTGYSSATFVVHTINQVTTPIPELVIGYFAIGRWKGYD